MRPRHSGRPEQPRHATPVLAEISRAPLRDQPVADEVRSDRLRQAQKMQLIGELAPGIAHELNNPLTAIVAFSQLLLGDERLPDDLREDARLLVREADRTQRLIRSLLEFARRRQPERQATDLETLVRSALELEAFWLAERRIDVRLDLAPGLPPIEIDRSAVQQVLLSLIVVAAHESAAETDPSHPRRIAIRVNGVQSATKPGVRIVVESDGELGADGREPEAHQTGGADAFALAVATAIVEDHFGELAREWDPIRQRARSIIELPVSAEGWPPNETTDGSPSERSDAVGVQAAGTHRGAEPVVETAAESATGGGDGDGVGSGAVQVLVLDDEAPIRGLLRRTLERQGFEPVLADSGDQALDLLRERGFDVLLVDHRMPRMDGLEFHRRALDVRPAVAGRIVFMSGDVMDADLQRVVEAWPVRVLGKPFELHEVAHVLEEVVASEGRLTD